MGPEATKRHAKRVTSLVATVRDQPCARGWEQVFPEGTYRQVFYVADVDAAGRPVDGELHGDLDEADFLAVFPLAEEGRVRLIGTVRDERADRADTLKFEDVSDRAIITSRSKSRR